MIKILVYSLFLFPLSAWGQFGVDVNLIAGNKPVGLNEVIQLNEYTLQLEQVRFYLSKFEFYQNGRLMVRDSTEAYLVDFEIDSTRKILFPNVPGSQIDEIRFLLGIDSITNTSGAMSGALDPMHGMYWSWQSGYINCKLEGSFITPKREAFQLHLGGYIPPFSGVQQLILKTGKTTNSQLSIDLNSLMDQIVQSKSELHIMSPCTRAVEYAQLLAKSIHLKP